MSTENITQVVKEKYGAAALLVQQGRGNACCGSTPSSAGCCDPITSNLYRQGLRSRYDRRDAGYQNGFEELSLSQRVAHPGTHGFPDATFDFIFAKNLTALQPTVTQTNASDHWPVTRTFRLH
jgi:hypothetical protein